MDLENTGSHIVEKNSKTIQAENISTMDEPAHFLQLAVKNLWSFWILWVQYRYSHVLGNRSLIWVYLFFKIYFHSSQLFVELWKCNYHHQQHCSTNTNSSLSWVALYQSISTGQPTYQTHMFQLLIWATHINNSGKILNKIKKMLQKKMIFLQMSRITVL